MFLTSIITSIRTPFVYAKGQISSLYDITNGLLPLPDASSSSSSHRGPGITANVPDNSNISPNAAGGGNNKIPDGSITTSKLADGAVTNSKLATDAVTTYFPF